MQYVGQQQIEHIAQAPGAEPGAHKAGKLPENVWILALKDPFAVRKIGKENAGHILHDYQHRVLGNGRNCDAGVKNSAPQEFAAPGNHRGHPADDDVDQNFAVLDA